MTAHARTTEFPDPVWGSQYLFLPLKRFVITPAQAYIYRHSTVDLWHPQHVLWYLKQSVRESKEEFVQLPRESSCPWVRTYPLAFGYLPCIPVAVSMWMSTFLQSLP
jgi:hypothetical protein